MVVTHLKILTKVEEDDDDATLRADQGESDMEAGEGDQPIRTEASPGLVRP